MVLKGVFLDVAHVYLGNKPLLGKKEVTNAPGEPKITLV